MTTEQICDVIDRATKEINRNTAEIIRLRAALEEIAGITPSRTIALLPIARQADHYWNEFVRCRSIAAAALLRIASGDREKPQP